MGYISSEKYRKIFEKRTNPDQTTTSSSSQEMKFLPKKTIKTNNMLQTSSRLLNQYQTLFSDYVNCQNMDSSTSGKLLGNLTSMKSTYTIKTIEKFLLFIKKYPKNLPKVKILDSVYEIIFKNFKKFKLRTLMLVIHKYVIKVLKRVQMSTSGKKTKSRRRELIEILEMGTFGPIITILEFKSFMELSSKFMIISKYINQVAEIVIERVKFIAPDIQQLIEYIEKTMKRDGKKEKKKKKKKKNPYFITTTTGEFNDFGHRWLNIYNQTATKLDKRLYALIIPRIGKHFDKHKIFINVVLVLGCRYNFLETVTTLLKEEKINPNIGLYLRHVRNKLDLIKDSDILFTKEDVKKWTESNEVEHRNKKPDQNVKDYEVKLQRWKAEKPKIIYYNRLIELTAVNRNESIAKILLQFQNLEIGANTMELVYRIKNIPILKLLLKHPNAILSEKDRVTYTRTTKDWIETNNMLQTNERQNRTITPFKTLQTSSRLLNQYQTLFSDYANYKNMHYVDKETRLDAMEKDMNSTMFKYYVGNHPQYFPGIEKFATSLGLDTGGCFLGVEILKGLKGSKFSKFSKSEKILSQKTIVNKLFEAIDNWNLEEVKDLLRRKNAKGEAADFAFLHALELNRTEKNDDFILEMLYFTADHVNHIPVINPASNENEALMIAAVNGDMKILKALLEYPMGNETLWTALNQKTLNYSQLKMPNAGDMNNEILFKASRNIEISKLLLEKLDESLPINNKVLFRALNDVVFMGSIKHIEFWLGVVAKYRELSEKEQGEILNPLIRKLGKMMKRIKKIVAGPLHSSDKKKAKDYIAKYEEWENIFVILRASGQFNTIKDFEKRVDLLNTKIGNLKLILY